MARDRARPRTWEELRRAVLEDDYMSVREMEERRRKAQLLRLAPWVLLPLALGLLPAFFVGAAPWWLLVGTMILGTHGSLTAYRVYKRWDPRWAELIEEKRRGADPC